MATDRMLRLITVQALTVATLALTLVAGSEATALKQLISTHRLAFGRGLFTVVQQVSKQPSFPFFLVAFARYYRLVIHIFSYLFLYHPTPIPGLPSVTPQQVHVIIPTVDPENPDFKECVISCLENRPGWLTIVTVGRENLIRTRRALDDILHNSRLNGATLSTTVQVEMTQRPNKRQQIAHVLRKLSREKDKDQIVVMLDDHVFWPSQTLLQEICAPFEDRKVGFVGTNKQVCRTEHGINVPSLLNFIACLYLERHNFEIRATNAIDGGVFVVSGRTSAIRASIVTDPAFLAEYTNEYFFFGRYGPLNPDDDNFITRWVVKHDWNIKIQFTDNAHIETTLGTHGGWQKFHGQLLRWARSAWRSNSCSLFTDRAVWRRQWWCLHAVYWTSFLNFAVLWDGLLVYTWSRGDFQHFKLQHLVLIILASKMVKLVTFFARHPEDLILFPFYVLFAYYHSWIKFQSLLTWNNHGWAGRNLEAIDTTPDTENGSHSGHEEKGDCHEDGEDKDRRAELENLARSGGDPWSVTEHRTDKGDSETLGPPPDEFDPSGDEVSLSPSRSSSRTCSYDHQLEGFETPWGTHRQAKPQTKIGFELIESQPVNVCESNLSRFAVPAPSRHDHHHESRSGSRAGHSKRRVRFVGDDAVDPLKPQFDRPPLDANVDTGMKPDAELDPSETVKVRTEPLVVIPPFSSSPLPRHEDGNPDLHVFKSNSSPILSTPPPIQSSTTPFQSPDLMPSPLSAQGQTEPHCPTHVLEHAFTPEPKRRRVETEPGSETQLLTPPPSNARPSPRLRPQSRATAAAASRARFDDTPGTPSPPVYNPKFIRAANACGRIHHGGEHLSITDFGFGCTPRGCGHTNASDAAAAVSTSADDEDESTDIGVGTSWNVACQVPDLSSPSSVYLSSSPSTKRGRRCGDDFSIGTGTPKRAGRAMASVVPGRPRP